MKKIVFVVVALSLLTGFAKSETKADRKPNQLSDVTYTIECSGKTKAGIMATVCGETDIFYNLNDTVELAIYRGGHADPSRVPADKFVYDSSHAAKDKAAHKNVFAFIHSPI